MIDLPKRKFPPGRILATPGALRALERSRQRYLDFLEQVQREERAVQRTKTTKTLHAARPKKAA